MVSSISIAELHSITTDEGLPYHDPRVTALVWELKYYASSRSLELAAECLSEHILALASEEIGKPLLIPIPMHPHRKRDRGHNHTELLAHKCMRSLHGAVEYAPQALRRTRLTPTQQGLPKAVREKNVRNSMCADPSLVKGRACIVLDDVKTTGATFAEAKRTLKEAGARTVHEVFLAQS